MRLVSRSVKDTLKIGRAIAGRLGSGGIILLYGKLGAGKTVLAKGIAAGLGIKKEQVCSPSFVLIREHKARLIFYHFDFYRLKTPLQILELGYEEYFYSGGVSVIEWPQRLKFLLPGEFIKIKLSIGKDRSRELDLSARGTKYKQLLGRIYEDIGHRYKH